MSRSLLCCALAALVATGCVSRSTHQQLQAELEACRQDQLATQMVADACEDRFRTQAARWDNLEMVIEEMLPRTITEFREERDRILQQIPVEVQDEVESYLLEFSGAMAEGFERMKRQNDQILTELAVYKQTLDEVGVRTRSIDETVGRRLEEAATRRSGLVDEAAAIIEAIQEFDRAHINDRTSDDRLRLNRNQRETITLFHDRLVDQLTALQRAAGGG